VDRPHSPSFLRNLGYWLIHCTLNSGLSFYLALKYMEISDNPPALFAMVAAILTFVIAYTILTTFYPPLSDKGSLFYRALKVGLQIRVIVVILSLLSFSLEIFGPFDLWCGVVAVFLYCAAAAPLGLPHAIDDGQLHSFHAIYSITILDGLILSITLFIFSLLALLVLNAKAKRKALKESAKPHG